MGSPNTSARLYHGIAELVEDEKSPAPRFHAATKAAREVLRVAYGLFLSSFQEAAEVTDPSLAEEVNLEWAAVFPELRKWIGDRVAQQGFAGKLKIRPELYEVTLDFDSIDIERGTALIQATEKATRIGRAFAVGKVLLAYRVLRENQLTYDGQDFFDNTHQHPDGPSPRTSSTSSAPIPRPRT